MIYSVGMEHGAVRGAWRISGKRALLILMAGVLIVTAVLYTVLVRLKLGGAEALRMRPAPATGAAPSH